LIVIYPNGQSIAGQDVGGKNISLKLAIVHRDVLKDWRPPIFGMLFVS